MMDLRQIGPQGPLHLSFVAGVSKRLVVAFAGVGSKRHETPPEEFPRIAHGGGENNVLFVSDDSRSWVNGDGMADFLCETITDVAQEIEAQSIAAIGNSMGGSAAMIVASKMPVDTVVAVTPQYSVHPEVIPQETRWTYFRKKISNWPFKVMPDLRDRDCKVAILHGGTPDELRHAEMFPQDAGYDHFIFPEHGHRVARGLNKAGQLAPIVTQGILGRSVKLRQAARAAGGISRAQFERRKGTFSEEALT
jgi:dienelactone hydrolase